MDLLLLATVVLAAFPDTTMVSGEVYGVWTAASSPYAVVGELTVPAGSTLVIEPGVEVRFRGRYRFVVNGLLKAIGTEQDSIFFTRDQPIEDHKWKGIRFMSSASGCTLAYAVVEYARNDGPFPEVRGGGIYCRAAAPVISHCSIRHNYSHNENYNGMGGGVCADSAEPVVEHCHILDNYVDSGGGIGTIENGQAIIQNCVIEDNTAAYSGGGMYLGARSGPRVFANIIRNNRCTSGWGGGGITLWNWYAINPVSKQVYNNLIAYNSASDAGGGMYTRYDLSYIYNNTFFGNSASRGGGIYVLNEGVYLPDVRNTIVWGNSASQGPSIYLDPGNSSDINVTWSDIEGGWSGSGNFDSVPNFADTVWFRLAMPSRCIDAGTSAGPPGHDFEGDERYDVPEVPNRGAGAEPFYDVGWDELTEVGVRGHDVQRRGAPLLVVPSVGREFRLSAGTVVYDIAGRPVRTARGETSTWSGLDSRGVRLAPGVYLVRDRTRVSRLVLTR
ncbi:MAG: hypothetical protein JSU73_06930 [candidate division WOR-3 bacterium]|nr:MAG: hypothetical protein JSU73_06930 [candidate division WOR-3 bacterium]